MPKHDPPLRGIVAPEHSVATEDGSRLRIAEAYPEDVDPATRGSSELHDGRARVAQTFVVADQTARAAYRRVSQTVEQRIKAAERSRKGKDQLPLGKRKEIKAAARQKLRAVTRDVKSHVRAQINEAVRREMMTQVARYRELGLEPPPSPTITGLRNLATKNAMSTPFPGTQATTLQRLDALRARAIRNVDKAIDATGARAAKRVDMMKRGLHDPKPGRTRVDGGSVSKVVQRIVRSEQSRAMREATLGLAGEMGAQFIYWRLSSAHKWYGGEEVCEVLAESTGGGVVAALEAAGVDPASVALEGLYLIESYPQVPHPNCICFQEPWFPPAALRAILVDLRRFGREEGD